MPPLIALTALTAVSLAAMPGAATASRTIRATTQEVVHIGDWKVGRQPLLRHAIRAYGRPDSMRSRYGQTQCAVRWRDLGLWADFANLAGQRACNPNHGAAGRVTISGRPAKRYRWRTWKGVRIGSSLRKLRRAHPSADRRRNGWWWIKTGRTYIGGNCADGCSVPLLKAHVKGGQVRSFRMWIGAAGD